MQVNSVVVSGRAVTDATMTRLEGGAYKATLMVEQWQKFGKDSKRQPKRHCWQVECWGKTAQNAAQYIGRGKHLVIQGELRSSSWQNADKSWNNRVYIEATNIDFLGGPNPTPANGDAEGEYNENF